MLGLPSTSSSLHLARVQVHTVTEEQGQERVEEWQPPSSSLLEPPSCPPTVAPLLPPTSLHLRPSEAPGLGAVRGPGGALYPLPALLALAPRAALAPSGELELHSALALGEEGGGAVLHCRHCPDFSTLYFHLLLPHLALHTSPRPPASVLPPSSRLDCSQCGKQFKKAEVLAAHVKRDHQGNLVPWECAVCGKGFTRKASLEEHMARHQGRRQRHCQPCDKWFYHTVSSSLSCASCG